MYDSPSSLQDYCVDYICKNMRAVCEASVNAIHHLDSISPGKSHSGFTFLHGNLTEKLIKRLGEKKKLTDSTLALFESAISNLKRLRLVNATDLTLEGLQMLKKHNFLDLEVLDMAATVSVSDFINNCLSEWTLHNLRSLNVANSVLDAKCLIDVPFNRLKCLRTLNVSNTEFNQPCLEVISAELPHLENLDISSTKVSDISPLRRCKDGLRSLNMYNLENESREEMIKVLSELHNLQHLDVSLDAPFTDLYPIRGLLSLSHALPQLKSLDISGNDDIDYCKLRAFLETHPQLVFLGLVHTSACENGEFVDEMHPFFNKHLTITGSGSEVQIVESLKMYIDRPLYIRKSLNYLFPLTKTYTKTRVDIVQLILPGMERYSKEINIQLSATACLYNLTKDELSESIHPKWLRKIVELTMTAMENFPTHMQLQRNTLLILSNDQILQDVTFDKYRCLKLVMDCLCAFEDASMNRKCVAICYDCTEKISSAEASMLGAQKNYMQKLLSIVKLKVDDGIADDTLICILIVLGHLTDDSPRTCSVLLETEGLNLFLDVLEKFQNDIAIEISILGLLNNIAEVKELRTSLMLDIVVENSMSFLTSSNTLLSYFAAGIIAHLASDGAEAWTVKCLKRELALSRLKDAVNNWSTADLEEIEYDRSFNCLFLLLNCPNSREVQLFAAWALHLLCNKNYKRYCYMLIKGGGDIILKDLVLNPLTDDKVKTISQSIIDILEDKGPFHICQEVDNLKLL